MAKVSSDSYKALGDAARGELYLEILKCPADTLRPLLWSICESNDLLAKTMHLALCIERASSKLNGGLASVSATGHTPAPATEVPLVDSTPIPPANEQSDLNSENDSASSDSSRKRKASESPASEAKRARIINLTRGQLHFKDRYVHCINCYELFDVLGEPCHEHDIDSSDDCSEADASDSEDEEDGHDCYYHSGYLEVNYEDECWDDHDENIHGRIDSDELRREHPYNYIWDCCNQKGDAEGCKSGRHEAGKILNYSAELNK